MAYEDDDELLEDSQVLQEYNNLMKGQKKTGKREPLCIVKFFDNRTRSWCALIILAMLVPLTAQISGPCNTYTHSDCSARIKVSSTSRVVSLGSNTTYSELDESFLKVSIMMARCNTFFN